MPESSSTSTRWSSPRATTWVQVLVALQWFVFMLASIITVPLVLGPALAMSPQQVARFTDQTLVVCGVLGLLQVCVGHRLPIVEGPAGMWWGVWTELINMARETGLSMHNLLQQLEFALLVGSVVYIALGALGWVNTVRRWFTAPVTGTFLVLLALQFSGPMVRGMLGLTNSTQVQLPVAGVSLLLVVVTLWLSVKGPGVLRTVAVLVGMVLGWVLYALLGWLPPWEHGGPVLALPTVLPYGPPQPLTGIAVTAVMTMVILLSNLIAAVYATASAAGEVMEPGSLRRGTLVSGLGTALAGLLGTPGM
ncbi:MAG: purine/pyrimidine permease, partial [Alicyclobacillus sp.]|nr:purine/pyrimidine permease [Alicyclobacillus sp.]